MPKGVRATEAQIIAVLQQAEAVVPVRDLCRQQNIATTTFHKWRAKFGGMEGSDAKRWRALEEENRRLQHLVADLTLDNQALKALTSQNFLSPTSGGRQP